MTLPTLPALFLLLLSLVGALAMAFFWCVRARHNHSALNALKDQMSALSTVNEAMSCVPLMVVCVDRDGRVEYANHAFTQWFCTDGASLVRASLADVVGTELFQDLNYYLQKALAGSSVDFELGIRSSDQQYHTHAVSLQPLCEQGGGCGYCMTLRDIAVRKEVERQYQDLRFRMEFILEAEEIGLWDCDLETGALHWDERMYDLYGIEESEFKGVYESWEGSLHPDDLERARSDLQSALKEDREFQSEFRVLLPSGEERWIEGIGHVLKDAHGKAIRMLGTNRDITQRKSTNERMEKLSLIASQTTNAVAVTDCFGQIEWLNRAFVDLSGYCLHEVRGRPLVAIFRQHDTDTDLVVSLNECIDQKTPFHSAFKNTHKSGREYWVDLRCDPISGDDGGIRGFMVFGQDITQSKIAEAQFARQQQMLESMSRHGRIGAWEIDVREDTVNWSKMTRWIHEVPEDFELDLETMIDFYKEGDSREAITRAINAGIENSIPWNVELPIITDRGRELWVNSTGQAHFENGECVRLYGSFQDVDGRVKIREQLLQAKEEAESAVRHKGEFLASMSHEIRTPMNGVLGMLNLLLRGELSESQKNYAQLAKSSAESLLTLINDILDFSKIEAGKLMMETIDFNLPEMISEFSQTIAHRAQERGVELIVDLSELTISRVQGDAGRLRQVLTNLVGNAIKFTSEGQVTIRAGGRRLPGEKYELHCSVVDSGIGIPKDKLSSLFESFTQVDASTTRRYGGTGLGLAIVNKLTALMDGSVTVTSVEGEGSCFKFIVTLGALEEENAEQHSPRFDNTHVLLGMKNPIHAEVLKTQLEQWGCVVTLITSVDQALQVMDDGVDAVLVDKGLPGKLAQELLRAVRSHHVCKKIYVGMLTDIIDDYGSSLPAGQRANTYIKKPVANDRLKDFLEKAKNYEGLAEIEEQSPLQKGLLSSPGLGTVSDAEIQSPEGGAALATAQGSTSGNEWLENVRLLLVEDNQINQIVVVDLLEDVGLDCDVAGNGVEAINSMNSSPQEAPYDLIMMDCQMPEMDGFEATRSIRQGDAGERYESIPIIAMTANAMKGDEEKCRDVGMDDYISKPIDATVLENRLRYWLIEHRQSNR